jgi:hypothetical protein
VLVFFWRAAMCYFHLLCAGSQLSHKGRCIVCVDGMSQLCYDCITMDNQGTYFPGTACLLWWIFEWLHNCCSWASPLLASCTTPEWGTYVWYLLQHTLYETCWPPSVVFPDLNTCVFG